jgi:hypothetical protein
MSYLDPTWATTNRAADSGPMYDRHRGVARCAEGLWAEYVKKDPANQVGIKTHFPQPRAHPSGHLPAKTSADAGRGELFDCLQTRVRHNPETAGRADMGRKITDLMPHIDKNAGPQAQIKHARGRTRDMADAAPPPRVPPPVPSDSLGAFMQQQSQTQQPSPPPMGRPYSLAAPPSASAARNAPVSPRSVAPSVVPPPPLPFASGGHQAVASTSSLTYADPSRHQVTMA